MRIKNDVWVSGDQQIQYIYRMINQLTLDDAVSKVYGKTLNPSKCPGADWQLFKPFVMNSTGATFLIGLLEVPAYMYTSQEICTKKIEKFKGILHEVKFIFVERCFQSSFYLLVAEQNLIPVSSMLKIKQISGEKVDEQFIYHYLEFAHKLQAHPCYNLIEFNEDQIGTNSMGQFVLANYLMYFEDHQKQNSKQKQDGINGTALRRDIRKTLSRMLIPSKENLDMMTIYSAAETKYGQNMLKIVEICMEPFFNTENAVEYIHSIKSAKIDESFSATITDTFVEDCQKMSEHFMNETCNTVAISDIMKIKKYQRSLKRKKIAGFIVVFVIILLGIGAITFKYLKPRPLECQDSQYADVSSNTCLSCDSTCERCAGSEKTMCVSCKGDWFLIMHDYTDKTGKCSEDCHGTVIRTKICIDKH